MKSGSLNLLEPSGPVQACNGTALPLPLPFINEVTTTLLPGATAIEGPETRANDDINPYPTAFPYGNGKVLHFYQQQESSTTKTVHKVINKGLKAYVYSPHTGEIFH